MGWFSRSLSLLVVGFGIAAFASDAPAPAPLKLKVYAAGPDGFHVTSTLIEGKKDAILVDGQFTLSEAHRLAAMILESGKNLKMVFVTHAHPDHSFGLEVLRAQFPKAKIVAPPKVLEQMRKMNPAKLKQWKPVYGNNLTNNPVVASAWTKPYLELDGEKIAILEMEPGEIEHSVVLHLPDTKAVIVGDNAYHGVHPWLAETDPKRRENWLRNIEKIQKLQAEMVVAGHKVPGMGDDPTSLENTAKYIRDFDEMRAKSANAGELKEKMQAKYGPLQLPIILELSTKAAFPAK